MKRYLPLNGQSIHKSLGQHTRGVWPLNRICFVSHLFGYFDPSPLFLRLLPT